MKRITISQAPGDRRPRDVPVRIFNTKTEFQGVTPKVVILEKKDHVLGQTPLPGLG